MSVPLHEHFSDVDCVPGTSHVTGPVERFALVNVMALGGEPDRPTHVPVELARLGPVVVWESTGSSAALPFWNTNNEADAWLLLVHGAVRIEFKEPETDVSYGYQECRTGDLFRLPKGIAHRTLSGDGRRRVSLELLLQEREPHPGRGPVDPDPSGRVGGFSFEVPDGDGDVVVRTPAGEHREDRHFLTRAFRALVAHELHLFHNELLGGLVVDDHGDTVTLKAHGYAETLDGRAVQAVFAGVLDRLGEAQP